MVDWKLPVGETLIPRKFAEQELKNLKAINESQPTKPSSAQPAGSPMPRQRFHEKYIS